MKQKLHLHRPAMAALFALVASSTAPVFAQDVTVVSPPPVVIDAPPPVVSAPPPVVTPTPAPLPSTPVARTAPPPAETRATPVSTRSTTRTVRTRTAAPVRSRPVPVQAAPAPAPAPIVAEPVAPVAAAPAPIAPAPIPVDAVGPVAEQNSLAQYWPWLAAAGALLLAALTLLALRRRHTAYAEREVYYDEPVYEAAPEPAYAAPVAAAAAADEVAASEPHTADMETLAASSEPAPDRPWLEFLMRPVRAGTSEDETVVEFELTVGNTGSTAARDVRVSTWMVAAGEGTEMERSLIEPPADATRSDLSIEPGDGARVDGAMALPKDGLQGDVLPVVVADARYTLPDGSEGRTHASFAVGRAGDGDGELEPFKLDRTGITENVEARLHGEPERV
ncbi:MAG TPA: hypothetical protein VEW04_08715 [Allosphingosinicella sp.]|nr:hypothetical protein [Allosphingosinicella sp.]